MRVQLLRWGMVVAFVILLPQQAHADLMGFWRWFDGLSGPGPFKGFVSEPSIIAYGKTKKAIEIQGADAKSERVLDLMGTEISHSHTYFRFGGQWGILASSHNNQDYGDRPAPTVWANPFAATFDVGWRGIEGGVAAGVVRFHGDDFSFWRGYLSPRAAVYPLLLFKPNYQQRWREVLQLRAGWAGVLGDIKATDFGAIEKVPPQKMGNELMPSVSVSVNVLALQK